MSHVSNLVPIGTGLHNNTSATLNGVTGALGVDSATNFLYLGNAGTWTPVNNIAATATFPGVTLTAAGQGNITGQVFINIYTIAGNRSVQFAFVPTGQPGTVTTGPTTWTSSTPIFSGLISYFTQYAFFSITFFSSTLGYSQGYAFVDPSGNFNIALNYASGAATPIFESFGGNYFVGP